MPLHKDTNPPRQAWLQKVWEDFVTGREQADPGRELVLQSWQRCKEAGVDPGAIPEPAPVHGQELRQMWQEMPVARELEPWVKQLGDISGDAGYLAVIADAAGRLMNIGGDRQIRSAAARMHFVEGAPWAEQKAGTNAIGTALASGQPVEIFGAEHFVQTVHPWTCAAAPIRDPLTGKPLAVVDLTGSRDKIHPFALELVKSVSDAVEERLRARLQLERYLLLERYLNEVGRSRADLIATVDRSGHVVRASALTVEEGFIDRDGRLAGMAEGAWSRSQGAQWEAEGRHGHRTFACQPVFDGNTIIGAIITAGPARSVAGALKKGETRYSFQSIIGDSPALQAILAAARKAATSHLPILIEGQSGTGKELLVQAIHAASPRQAGPFVAVNCGAIPKELVASEFFGYEAGTFTGGAREGRAGKFQQADGGTIFLDEIGEMPLDAQVHLLRVLEEGEVVRVGGHKPVRVNVRVIAATNQDLNGAVQSGAFRRDLYYRLNVLSIHMPALKERAGDIPLLANVFLNRAAVELGRHPLTLSGAAVAALESYDWPGNVRELRNVMYRVALLASGQVVEVSDLPPEVRQPRLVQPPANAVPDWPLRAGEEERELAQIRSALAATNGNVVLAARQLGIHRSTIYRKLRKQEES